MTPFTAGDIFRHRSIHGLQGSAAHGQVVFSVARAVKAVDDYRTSVWLLAPAGEARARRMISSPLPATSPLLDPAGERLAFLSSRGDDGPQVQLMRLDGGEARPVSSLAHNPQALQAWSPDGARLLLTVQVPWAEEGHDDPEQGDGRPWVVNFLPYKFDGGGPVVGSRVHLLELDTGSGAERMLVEGDFDVKEARWSPDGRRLAFVRSRSGAQRHRSDLWLAEADGRNARQLTRDLAVVSGVSWSPDGARLAFAGSGEEGTALRGLWLLDVGGGEAWQPAGEDLQLEGATVAWHREGDRLVTIAARQGLKEAVVVDVGAWKDERATGNVVPVTGGLRHVLGLCASGDRIVFVATGVRRLDEVHSVRWDGSDPRRHTSFNRKWFAARPRPRVGKRRFEVPDGDGGTERIDAWLLLPAEGDGPFPLLLDLHAGPESVVLIDYASHPYWYELCANGWAVLAPNAVGSTSYGARFAQRLRGHWGELDLPQHLAVIDALQREGIASGRLACTGESYGGYLAAWAVGHSSRFGAAVIRSPVINLESHAGTSDTGYYVDPYAMEGEIHQARGRYHRLSPVAHCRDVTAATLLLQGQDDQRCPLAQSEELFAGLVRSSRARARMVVYPGAAHSLASSGRPSHRLDYHRRLVAWVREHA
jgi:dipeptidyl aminopeptidase/acylaminoacyl peptidase